MKKTNNMLKLSSLVATAIVGATISTQAAVVTWTGAGGDNLWSTAANWGGTGPVSGADTVVINGAYTVDYDVVSAQNFADIDVLGGATLNMLTGAFTLPGANNFSTGRINGAGSVINFIGGSHDFSTRMTVNSGGTIRVTGGDAMITMGQTAAMGGAIFDFVFDSDGVSSLDFLSYVQGIDKPGAVTVDGSSYTGGSGEFTLINANPLIELIDSISVSGFASYFDTVITQDQTADRVYLTVSVVPEPSSTALLGLGGLAFALRRRR